MCGIVFSNFVPKNKDKILETLRNRGPDNSDYYSNSNKKIFIGHTRLAIIDLDKRSNQPLRIGNCIISFNGEIYNYKKIKQQHLHDYKFKTDSDTEVIINLYRKYGIYGFKYLEGMYAFILYDMDLNKTFFLRDPIGIKPLYYYFGNQKIIAASLIKTIKEAHPPLDIRPEAINDILALGYPRFNFYRHVGEFSPGYVYDDKLNSYKIDYEKTNKKFKIAIAEQFISSDVPVGITLSGGVDSSYIAYIASKYNKNPIHTFTIGTNTKDEDVIKSRKIAKMIGSKHHEIIIKEEDLEKDFKKGIEKINYPMELGSVALTNRLGKEISKHKIKVILIGEGADEIQGGYKRYSEPSGKRGNEIVKFYQDRIIKNDLKERKTIIGDGASIINFNDTHYPLNGNYMFWFDFEHELRYYHLKRIDHIISEFGIEARVPYLDHNIVFNTLNKNFQTKINSHGNKYLLRKEAYSEGLPEEFSHRTKTPLKRKINIKDKITEMIKNDKRVKKLKLTQT